MAEEIEVVPRANSLISRIDRSDDRRGSAPRGDFMRATQSDTPIFHGTYVQTGYLTTHSSVNIFDGYSKPNSFFGALTEGIRSTTARTQGLLAARAQKRAGKTTSLPENIRNRPYTTVQNEEVKLRLLPIGKAFQFLDRGFAEYFHTVLPSFGKDHIQSLLDDCRVVISRDRNQDDNSTVIDLGDLGNFCEEDISTWDHSSTHASGFSVTIQQADEMIYYLQDALEIPYWHFMLDLFHRWRGNNKSLSGDVVLLVLRRVRDDLNEYQRQLEKQIKSSRIDQKDMSFILEGIAKRMKILNDVLSSNESEFDPSRKVDSPSEESHRTSAEVVEKHPSQSQPQPKGDQSETVALISLVLAFLMLAIAPGYKAFALSMQDGTVGSINDADFWYLVQNSVMAVLGNIIMVVPLLRKSWFSPAYNLMWIFFTLGLVFAGVAVAIYPFLNTGWSSMASFFGSISSIASVLVMTQAVAKEARHDKIKAD